MEIVEIFDNKFEVLDSLNNITLADSFLLNKTGRGHGEAKMYVGNESDELGQFFYPMDPLMLKNGFFLRSDFETMLQDLKLEYLNPQQQYLKSKLVNRKTISYDVTGEMPKKWETLNTKVKNLDRLLLFEFHRSDIIPPRVYINSESEYYNWLRNIGIPNISFCSILKLKNIKNDQIQYYFKPFVDYSNSIESYSFTTSEEKKELEDIAKTDRTATSKKRLVNARIGQGKYREDLLDDMPCCPFTKINDERLLIASHIKPWVKSTDSEKIDSQNGLILSPTYDALFDKGLMSFSPDGSLLVSPFVSPMNQKRLQIKTGQKIGIDRYFSDKRLEYLEYHRKYVFKSINV